jgi:hypothetical protein
MKKRTNPKNTKDMLIQSTVTPPSRPDFNTWALGIHNRLKICNTCKENFREKDVKVEYVADSGCVSGMAVCPFCGSDSHRYAKYFEG